MILDEIKLTAPKTKEVAAIAQSLKLDKRTLLILTDKDTAAVRAARNIPNLKTIPSNLINVYDLMASTKCVATLAAIKKIEEAYKE
jgi:large subunit ribosomal protein L4